MHQRARSIVVGLGRTGLSCARYLHARHESFAVTDSRAAPPESAALQKLAPEAEVHFGAFDEALLDDASRVIASPGVSLREPFMMSAAIRGVPIIGDIELFAREAQAPIAAITGTNGKSTVTTLVAKMAEAAGKRVLAGGNLGRPALDLLDEPVPELYVLELSSFQLETTRSLRTATAVVLNVTPDHMDRYESVGEYAAAKARIFQHCDAAVDESRRSAGAGDAASCAARARRSVCARIAAADYYALHVRRGRRADARRTPGPRDVRDEDRRPAQRRERAGGACHVRRAATAAGSRACRRCASFPGCRIARSGSPTCAACAT